MTPSRADLCVVGAGISALNALVVASGYLDRSDRVVLIEKRPGPGGMWRDTYPYVRLHQPHPLFTAGAVPWQGGHARSYLAARDEVVDHFARVVDVVRRRVDVEERYGCEFMSDEEQDGRVLVRARDQDGAAHVVDTARLIKGYGVEIGPDLPLAVTSERVRSITPTSLDEHFDGLRADSAPVWIIGGGKTAMDTAYRLVTELPGREVRMLAGAGTFFSSRDRLFPRGRARWRPRATPNMINAELARRFDGTNEDEVRRWLRETVGLSLMPDAQNYLYGLLSRAELRTIANGLAAVVPGYLVDVHDCGDAAELVLRSGETLTVPAGTWLVNCTGFFRPSERPYEPYASPSGNVLTLSTRSATMLLSSFMGYFMAHMMFAGRLGDTPLYELDLSGLLERARPAVPYVLATLGTYNLSLMSDALPGRAFRQCGLDFDRLSPAPYRLASTVAFVARHKRDRPHHQRALDTVRERFDIRCGPLEALAA